MYCETRIAMKYFSYTRRLIKEDYFMIILGLFSQFIHKIKVKKDKTYVVCIH